MSTASAERRIPELDGLRALAVLPVIALHFGADVNGGAGVTVFFALSGFLITTLLIGEHARRGSVSVSRFYLRRFRRLLPAATTVVIATVIVGRLMHKPPITRQAVASLTYWANFERYSSHYSYGQINYAPLEHFWSLAIEEQFYLVLPLLCILVLPLGRQALGGIAGVGLVASAAFAYVHRGNPQMYFHSAARVCELLAGVVLAVVLPKLRPLLGRRSWMLIGLVGVGGLIAVFARAITPQPVLVALMACLVIAGRPRLLAAWPLVLIGTYSYGLYLWHPLAEVLSDRLVVRITFTVVFTVASFHLIEFPIRRTMTIGKAVSAMGALSVTALVVIALPQAPATVRFVGTAPVVPVTTTAPVPPLAPVPPTTPPASSASSRPLRISAAGDSTQMFADAAWQAFAAAYRESVTWVEPPADLVPWTSGADGWGEKEAAKLGLVLAHDGPQGGLDRQGCPMIYDLPIRAVDTYDFEASEKLHSATPISSCDWHLWIPAALSTMHLDVLVVSWAVTDMWEYKLADGRSAFVGDPEFDTLLGERMAEFEAMAAQFGTRVVWTTYQPISGDALPARWTKPETADALAADVLQRPCASDLREVVRADPTFAWYQDGYHFTPEGAARAVAAIMPEVTRCAALGPPRSPG